MFFDSWQAIARIIITGVLAYAALIILLRAFGKRTLSKMNAFDFIVTVALGSTLASVLTSKSVTLADGLTALLVLILLQYVITWSSVRSKLIGKLVKSEPKLLFRNGEYLPGAMKNERVTEDEIRAAIREQGGTKIEDIAAVVLETDGSLSVVKGDRKEEKMSSLEGVNKNKQ